jgi:ribosomal RNA-processing protein 8
MFTVKGWNVDAKALKPQTEPFKSAGPDGEQKQGRKRKRGNVESTESKDVGQLWEQHIDKKEPKKQRKEKTNASEKAGEKGEQPSNDDAKTTGPHADNTKQADAGAKNSKKKDKKAKKQHDRTGDNRSSANLVQVQPKDTPTAPMTTKKPPPPAPPIAKLTPMQAAMRQKLISARFRHLNQTLYTEASPKALELFDQNPEMFEDYHSGFRQQVAVWPENPLDTFIATIRARGQIRLQTQKSAFKGKKKGAVSAPVPRVRSNNDDDGGIPHAAPLPRTQGTCIIADLGCGDARLAQTLRDSGDGQKLQLKVLSYDLHSPSPLVTKADISRLPAAEGSVDVAIFCLALMGTNWIAFVEEAYRVLHWKGELWVAEIKSRFGRVGRGAGAGAGKKVVEHSVGGKRKLAALKKGVEKKAAELEDVREQDVLAVEVDGVEPQQNVATDVSAFVDVLKRRGFVLKNGEASIDLSNKMFVKMEFLKAAQPTKGKNKVEEAKKPVERFKKAKFLDEEKEEPTTEDEAKTLKPCLYKQR